MRFLRPLIAACLLAAPVSLAAASDGVVVMNESGCRSRYVVATSLGYAILEWYGGHDPSEGERVFGNFESYGFKDVRFSGGSKGRVWVEDYWLSKDSVLEKMAEFCS